MGDLPCIKEQGSDSDALLLVVRGCTFLRLSVSGDTVQSF